MSYFIFYIDLNWLYLIYWCIFGHSLWIDSETDSIIDYKLDTLLGYEIGLWLESEIDMVSDSELVFEPLSSFFYLLLFICFIPPSSIERIQFMICEHYRYNLSFLIYSKTFLITLLSKRCAKY